MRRTAVVQIFSHETSCIFALATDPLFGGRPRLANKTPPNNIDLSASHGTRGRELGGAINLFGGRASVACPSAATPTEVIQRCRGLPSPTSDLCDLTLRESPRLRNVPKGAGQAPAEKCLPRQDQLRGNIQAGRLYRAVPTGFRLVHAGVDGGAVGPVAELAEDGVRNSIADLVYRTVAEGHVAHAGVRAAKVKVGLVARLVLSGSVRAVLVPTYVIGVESAIRGVIVTVLRSRQVIVWIYVLLAAQDGVARPVGYLRQRDWNHREEDASTAGVRIGDQSLDVFDGRRSRQGRLCGRGTLEQRSRHDRRQN